MTTPAWPSGSGAPCWPAISPSRSGAASRSCCRRQGWSGCARHRTPAARIDALSWPRTKPTRMAALRRFRRAEALRLVFRDVNGLDELPATCPTPACCTKCCWSVALDWSERQLAPPLWPRPRRRRRVAAAGGGGLRQARRQRAEFLLRYRPGAGLSAFGPERRRAQPSTTASTSCGWCASWCAC